MSSQSEILAGALIGAFVIYLLMTKRLGAYWALLTGGGASAAADDATAQLKQASPAAGMGGQSDPKVVATPGTAAYYLDRYNWLGLR